MVFSQNPLPTLPWLATLWAIEKAFVLHQLNLPYEEMPLDLLKKLISMMPMFMERRPGNPGVFNAMIFMLLVNKIIKLLCVDFLDNSTFTSANGRLDFLYEAFK